MAQIPIVFAEDGRQLPWVLTLYRRFAPVQKVGSSGVRRVPA